METTSRNYLSILSSKTPSTFAVMFSINALLGSDAETLEKSIGTVMVPLKPEHKPTPRNTLGAFFSHTSFVTVDDIMGEILCNHRFARLALLEVYEHQTDSERIEKGTSKKNRFGFSKREVTRGTELAIKIKGGTTLTSAETAECVNIAVLYREQIHMYVISEVPRFGSL